MIKIGDFARLTQVSVVTLRHYDELGLFKPIRVDPVSGYRYYSIYQLPRLNRILALKDLGFSLDQIDKVLNGITLEELRGMLKLKQAEVAQKLTEEQLRLERIADRLKQIEMENVMSKVPVIVKQVPAMLVASCEVTIPTNDQVPVYLGAAYEAVWKFIGEHSLKPMGANLTRWHQAAEVLVDEVAEALVPVDRPAANQGRVRVYELPAVEVASYVHEGNFEDFGHGHTVLLKWIEDHGYRIAGDYREIYIKHNLADLSDSITEIQYPIEK